MTNIPCTKNAAISRETTWVTRPLLKGKNESKMKLPSSLSGAGEKDSLAF